jgi:hypothetical protein
MAKVMMVEIMRVMVVKMVVVMMVVVMMVVVRRKKKIPVPDRPYFFLPTLIFFQRD